MQLLQDACGVSSDEWRAHHSLQNNCGHDARTDNGETLQLLEYEKMLVACRMRAFFFLWPVQSSPLRRTRMTRMQFLYDECDVTLDEWRERERITKEKWNQTRDQIAVGTGNAGRNWNSRCEILLHSRR